MNFDKRYDRHEFLRFLGSFLPEDFTEKIEEVLFDHKTTYIRQVTRLGRCQSLDLLVYEMRHNSVNDARVGLSKEAFRFLANEWEGRALVLFVPENNDANYRFSLITIDLDMTEEGKTLKRYSNPRRYSYYLGEGIAWYTPNKYLNEAGRVKDEKDLIGRFSVEVLTKAFYQELSDWYAWAVNVVRFPNKLNDPTDDDKFNAESTIRLVTRLIFVWFLKQKHLIPEEFFDETYIRENLLENFNPNTKVDLFSKSNESKYYKAILQNLFFAMLNSPITPEGSTELSERHFRNGRGDYDNNKLMRYESYFKNPQLFVDLANRTVPFLNGGLFDCLDDKDNGVYIDGFSDREIVKKALIVPDYLFFGEEVGKNLDLSRWYGDNKKKKVSASGIIDILKRYNFTVEENTPFDQEVSLDPELLGKVFENLLASYNPETQTTARKQTGSFYTPREIVQYMVDESLVAHLKRTVGDELEEQYRQLMRYTDEEVPLTDVQRKQIMQSLYHCKVLDPACGSGAFPMGMLQQMVHILNRIDPDNEMWKEMMRQAALCKQNLEQDEIQEVEDDLNRNFNDGFNRPDYARKLYLIENCIYGVDIQPIAIQISKLRFFISLVVDQKANDNPAENFGIRPLPNLEAKFVAANTLIGLDKKDSSLFDTPEILAKKEELKIAKHKIFGAKTVRTKRKYKEAVNRIRQEIAELLRSLGAIGESEAAVLASWDMFDQNASSPFFDPEWMFDVKEGFDIVIGNPPYIDSETMKSNMPRMRAIYKALYSCASGNWDIYVVFIERGMQLLTDGGVESFIVPNKLIASKYAQNIRTRICQSFSLLVLRDYSRVSVFEAFVYPCVFLIQNEGLDTPALFQTMNNIDKILSESYIDKKIFKKDIFWDKYFLPQKTQSIIQKINSYQPISTLNVNIYGAATVSEAYDIKPLIEEYHISAEKYLKFINTGTIDPYKSYWGIKKTQYIKGTYIRPIINMPALKDFSSRRYEQSISPKIIVAGMSLNFEAIYDEGQYVAGKSTTIITGEPTELKYYTAIINSKLLSFWLTICYNSLKMAGGYINIGVNEISSIPICLSEKYQMLVNIVDSIQSSSDDMHIKQGMNKIDNIVYHLYGLTYDDVLIVDPQTPITREEYENYA